MHVGSDAILTTLFPHLQQKMFYKGKDTSDSRRSSRANGTATVETPNDSALSEL